MTDEQIDLIMEQAQVFASARSLVGGPFDSGAMLETAEQEKAKLHALLAASNPTMPVDVQIALEKAFEKHNYPSRMNGEERSKYDFEAGWKARAALQAVPAADAITPGRAEGWIAFSDRLPPTKDNGRGDTAHQKVLVTNNISARDAFGNPSHVWLGSPFIDNETGEWRVYEGGRYLTHWMDPFPVSAPTGDQAERRAE